MYVLSTSPTVVLCGQSVEDAILMREYKRRALPQAIVDHYLVGELREEQV